MKSKKKEYLVSILIIVLVVVSCVICWFVNNGYEVTSAQYLELYKEIITDEIDGIDLTNESYIAVDAYGFTINSTKEQTELINYLGKYNKPIIVGTYDFITKDSYFTDSNNNIKGVLLTVTSLTRKGNTVNITVSSSNSISSSSLTTYKAIYRLNKWNIEKTSQVAFVS